MRKIQGELKVRIREVQEKYRKRKSGNSSRTTSEVWSGTTTITGFRANNNRGVEGNVDRANELNLFFNRFDTEGQAHLPSDSSAACTG